MPKRSYPANFRSRFQSLNSRIDRKLQLYIYAIPFDLKIQETIQPFIFLRWFQSNTLIFDHFYTLATFNNLVQSNTTRNNSKNPDTDSTHPYFVHQSDHPNLMLVLIKLNDTNYPSWSKSMIYALTTKNRVGFINGSIQPPSETEQPIEYAL